MDKILSTLGIVYKAKMIVLGEEVLNQISDIKLIIIASDISEKSRQRFLKKCDFYNISYINEFTASQISNALGKNNVKVVGIIDEGFKNSLLNK